MELGEDLMIDLPHIWTYIGELIGMCLNNFIFMTLLILH